MPKNPGSKRSRLSAEEQLLEKQRNELVRRQQELERKLKRLPVAIEAQEEQKRETVKRQAVSAGPAISSYMGRSDRRRGKGRTLRTPSHQRFAAQMKTLVLVLIFVIILVMLFRILPS